MPIDNDRLLMELEKHRRELNRETINPAIKEMSIEDLKPVIAVCAKARASYIETLVSIANDSSDSAPTSKQIDSLKLCRNAYEELVEAANALETVIGRGYIDVAGSSAS